MKQYVNIFLIGLAVTHCSNIGFVDKAKAVASNSFGIEVFAFGGSVTGGAFLVPATAALDASCTQGGISKANCACQNEANSRQFTGTFRAWLSIGNVVDAICNVQGIESTGCAVESSLGPFVARKSSGYVVLASDYSELSTSGFRTALEDTGRLLYTGSNVAGRATGADCSGFTIADTSIPTWGSSGLASTDFTTGASANSCTSTPGTILCMRRPK
jgi:hypothetical protein